MGNLVNIKMNVDTAFRSFRAVPTFIFFASLLFTTPNIAYTQNIPLGEWNAHFNYRSAHQLALTGNRVFCASYNGLASVDLKGQDLKTYSKQDGLTENGIACLAYDVKSQTLILAYRSGHIDLVELDDASNIENIVPWPVLQSSSNLPDYKKLNKVLIHNNSVYLATNFGIVVLDVQHREISENYRYIGPKGAEVEIRDIAITADSIYALTPSGLIASSMSPTTNRQYFENWKTSLTPATAVAIAVKENTLYAGIVNKGIYSKSALVWNVVQPSNSSYYHFSTQDKVITATLDNSIIQLSENTPKTPITNPLISAPKDAIYNANTLWIADSQNGLLSGLEETFQQHNPEIQDTTIHPRPDSTIIDLNGNTWTRLPTYLSGGIMIKNATSNKEIFLNTSVGYGGLPSSTINSLAVDEEGYIWFASDRGVGYISADELQSPGNINAILPIYGQRKLFSNEKCTAIAVESGNRKWIGTRNGLYHFSADGSEQLQHFTVDNSPLPSNHILSLKLEPETGLLYIDTPLGMMSYRTSTLAPTQSMDKLTIFPNPVRPGYAGIVGFKGLANHSIVKITQLSGRLVYETTSNGGLASWNLNDYTGQRVKGGIYMVFINSPDGNQKLAGKLAIIE